MIFNWSLSDKKFSQVSRTLLSILVDLNNGVVWMVFTRPLISKSSSPCTNPLGHCIDMSTLPSLLASPLPPSLLDTYSLSTSSLGRNALCIVFSFLFCFFGVFFFVLCSFCLRSSLVHFKNGPEYLTRGTDQIFIPLIRFLL